VGALKGKVAIVTGASRGIGRAIAEVFAREDARVVICGRKLETLNQVASEIGPSVKPIACHVGRADQIEHFGPCLDIDEAQFDKMIEINLKSAFRLVKAVAPGMCDRGSGSIINIASIAGLRPQLHSLLYSMTKAALIMMTQSYALELGTKGVRVNAIAPGLIQTALSEHYWKDEAQRDSVLAKQPIQRLGQPSDIAELALLLASERGSYITGQTFAVDGGFLLPGL
jgi:NAD(P)-dependent dehydrogenase (short-subunit alcohol dehydrogenase family)